MVTVRRLWQQGSQKLKKFPLAGLEARLLLQKALGIDEKEFILGLEERVSPSQQKHFTRLLRQRLTGCPLALILGEKEFWSLPLRVKKGVFLPRPETETLVELALGLPWPENGLVVDLGTGCGAIACALARERPKATIVATDISKRAIRLAQENAARLKIRNIIFVHGTFFLPLQARRLEGKCDLIVSNPPYVMADDWAFLSPAIRLFEPRRALVAGKTGLEAIRRLAKEAPAFLRPGGYLLLEIGEGQLDSVLEVLKRSGWDEVSWKEDLAHTPRVVAARWSG